MELVESEFPELSTSFEPVARRLKGQCFVLESRCFLYVGKPDSLGEYPIFSIDTEDCFWIGISAPFDIWLAQQSGVLEKKIRTAMSP